MKRILFVIHYLELGGAERSLLGLLGSLDYSQVEADLFVYAHRGELMGMIPQQVHLLPEVPEYAQLERPLREVVRDGYLRIALARLQAKRRHARYARRTHPRDGSAIFSYIARSVAPLLPPIASGKEYDQAVSYLAPHDFVLSKVQAKEKICWIHTDYTQIDVDTMLEGPVWSAYDRIAAISESVRDAFLQVFPALAGKVFIRENLVPADLVRAQAALIPREAVEKEMPRLQDTVILLSVGRFCHAKNYDNVPDICRRLNEGLRPHGRRAVWYLIGFGGDEALIREKIRTESLPGQVVILGKKANPYPYMKACDFYVQPSRYEGSPVTVREAQALGKPVILTAFPTAGDLVAGHTDTWIVPLDNEGCAAALVKRTGA